MSDRRREANRRNARKSTGPRSEEGKAKVSRNRLVHGLRASYHVLVGDETFEDVEAFTRSVCEDLKPEGPLETEIAERMATCLWRLRRVERIEAGLLDGSVTAQQAASEEASFRIWNSPKAPQTLARANVLSGVAAEPVAPGGREPSDMERVTRAQAAQAFQRAADLRCRQEGQTALVGQAFAQHANEFAVLSRYEAALERRLLQMHEELVRLQVLRGAVPDGAARSPSSDRCRRATLALNGSGAESPSALPPRPTAEAVPASHSPTGALSVRTRRGG
jgi:hypothetical protein